MKKIIVVLLLVFLVSCSNNNVKKKEEVKQKDIVKKIERNNTIKRMKKSQGKISEKIDKTKVDKKKSNENVLSPNYANIEKLLNDKKIERAEKLLKKEDSNNFGTLHLYARLYFEKKEYKKALEKQELLNEKKGGKDSDVLYFLGVIYDNLGDKQKAREYIEKSLIINPNNNLAKDYLKKIEGEK